MNKLVTSSGKLSKRFHPALYLDTSAIIDYWITDGMELPPEYSQGFPDQEDFSLGQLAQVVRVLFKSDIRINKVNKRLRQLF